MSLFNILTVLTLALIVVGGCGFAVVKGGPGERYGAAIYGLVVVVEAVYEFLSGQAAPAVPMLAVDLAIAVSFLVLAIRYNNLWMGAAMILQGIEFGLHVSRLTDAHEPRLFGLRFYVLAMNVGALLILFIMVGATISTLYRRKHPKHDDDDDFVWEPAAKA
jgi:hypothetical protein